MSVTSSQSASDLDIIGNSCDVFVKCCVVVVRITFRPELGRWWKSPREEKDRPLSVELRFFTFLDLKTHKTGPLAAEFTKFANVKINRNRRQNVVLLYMICQINSILHKHLFFKVFTLWKSKHYLLVWELAEVKSWIFCVSCISWTSADQWEFFNKLNPGSSKVQHSEESNDCVLTNVAF